MDIAAILGPTVAALVGAAQCALIWYGIRAMARAGDQRAAREDARHAEAMQGLQARHAEAMQGLDVRHDEAMQRHDEAMQGLDARHAEAMRRLDALHQGMEASIKSMETVIERTADRSQR